MTRRGRGRGVRRACGLPGRVILAALVLVIGAACQVDVGVGVDTRPDGSGTVQVTATLDKEAAAQAGPLALDDLRRAGWQVDGPTATASGGAVVRAVKPFGTPAQLASVMGEVSGAKGPFHDFSLRRKHSFFRTTTRFAGVVDLSPGVAGFTDDDLRQRLGTADSALDPATVERVTRARLNQLFGFTVTARLPGSITSSNAPTELGNGAVWKPKLGERVAMVASSRRFNTAAITYTAVAALAALALLVLLVVRLVRGWARRSKPKADAASTEADTPPP